MAPVVFEPLQLREPLCWHWRQGKECPQGESCRFRHECPAPAPAAVEPHRSYRLLTKNFPEHEFELLARALQEAGFFPAPRSGAPPALLWSASAERPHAGFGPETRVNRLGSQCALTHKHALQRSLRRAGATDVAPETFILPEEREVLAARVASAGGVWVVKPQAGGRGAGIHFTPDPVATALDGPCVVSARVAEPLALPCPLEPRLAAGEEVEARPPKQEEFFKADLRLYVLVASYDPLEAFLHEQGLVRYAWAPYTAAPDASGDLLVHLTYIRSHDAKLHKSARRRNSSLPQLRKYIAHTRGPEAERALWLGLCSVIWRTLAASPAVPQPRPRAPGGGLLDFELLGFDVLLDQALRPWVLEVNSQPDLSSSGKGHGVCYPADHSVKAAVVADVLTMLRLPGGPDCDDDDRDRGLEDDAARPRAAGEVAQPAGGFHRLPAERG